MSGISRGKRGKEKVYLDIEAGGTYGCFRHRRALGPSAMALGALSAAVNEDSVWAGSLGKRTHCTLQSTEQQKKKVKSLTFGTAWLTSQWTPQQTAAVHNLYLLPSPACRDPEEDEEDTPGRNVH